MQIFITEILSVKLRSVSWGFLECVGTYSHLLSTPENMGGLW